MKKLIALVMVAFCVVAGCSSDSADFEQEP